MKVKAKKSCHFLGFQGSGKRPNKNPGQPYGKFIFKTQISGTNSKTQHYWLWIVFIA